LAFATFLVWRLRRWRLWFLALMTTTRLFLPSTDILNQGQNSNSKTKLIFFSNFIQQNISFALLARVYFEKKQSYLRAVKKRNFLSR